MGCGLAHSRCLAMLTRHHGCEECHRVEVGALQDQLVDVEVGIDLRWWQLKPSKLIKEERKERERESRDVIIENRVREREEEIIRLYILGASNFWEHQFVTVCPPNSVQTLGISTAESDNKSRGHRQMSPMHRANPTSHRKTEGLSPTA